MVGPRVEGGAGQRCGGDGQPVFGHGDCRTQATQLRRERRESVGFLQPQVCDAPQAAGRIGEDGERRERGSGLAVVGEVHVDATQALRAAYLETDRRLCDGAAHRGQQLREQPAGLHGCGRPVGEDDATAGRRRRRKEGSRAVDVGLDDAVVGEDPAGCDRPARRHPRLGPVDVNLNRGAGGTQVRNGHLQVRP